MSKFNLAVFGMVLSGTTFLVLGGQNPFLEKVSIFGLVGSGMCAHHFSTHHEN